MPNITLVTQVSSRLSKQQMPDGSWQPASNVYDAQAETISTTLAVMPNLLNNIQNDQALILGTMSQASSKIITASSKTAGSEGITRSKENFDFSDGAALMLLDIDFKQCSSPLTKDDVIQALRGVANDEFGYVVRESTTSGIKNPDGLPLGGGDGFHIYVEVKHGKNIPRILKAAHQRLVLAGHGFVFVTQAGTGQVRSMVDIMVGSPERVIYEAAPVLLQGYTPHREAKYVAGGAFTITELSKDELVELENIEAKLLADAQPRMDTVRNQWREVRGYTEGQASEILNNHNLPEDFEITNNDNSTFTVGDVWRNPDEYDGIDIRDPTEPEYGKNKAKIYVNKRGDNSVDSIIISSMAHGGDISYRLTKSIEMLLEGLPEPHIPTEIRLPNTAYPKQFEVRDFISDISHDALASQLGSKWFYENARYVDVWGKWLLWNGSRWFIDARLSHLSVIGKFLKACADELLNQANQEVDVEKREKKLKAVKSEAKNLKSAPFRHNIEIVIKTDPACSVLPDIFDMDLHTIGTPGGTINLKTGELIKALPEHYITKSTQVSPDKSEPINWLLFLDKIFDGDLELIAFMQRLCGYILTGLTVEERLFFLYGTGSNGKSKFLETLFFIMGDYSRRAPASLFLEHRGEQHPTAMAGLNGARMVLSSELPSGKTWNEEVIKDLTGGDTITARLMRQDFFDFKPQFALIIAGNHQPRLKNVDESMVRRITLIPFRVTIPKEERDTTLGDKLKDEAGAILNWCVQGAVDYYQNGLNIPDCVNNAGADYIVNEDTLGEFMNGYLQKHGGERVRFTDVYHSYTSWMLVTGVKFIKREKDLKKEMTDRGLVIKRSNSIYWLDGYRLRNPELKAINDSKELCFM
jgi:P4 family phage/plasmid primase-like protien